MSRSHRRYWPSNGVELLPNVDGPLTFARRHRQITGAIMAELGGADQCSESRKQFIRRFATAAVLAEQWERRRAGGEGIDIKDYASLCATMVSIARHLGVDQVTRTVTQTLAEYLELKALQEKSE